MEYKFRHQRGDKVRVFGVESKDSVHPHEELVMTANSNLTIQDGNENVLFRCY